MSSAATTRTEIRPLREWLDHQVDPFPGADLGFVTFLRSPDHDVILVHDGMCIWAARPDALEEALDREVEYRLSVDEGRDYVGTSPVATQAYTDLCQDLPALPTEVPGIKEACAAHDLDPDILQT